MQMFFISGSLANNINKLQILDDSRMTHWWHSKDDLFYQSCLESEEKINMKSHKLYSIILRYSYGFRNNIISNSLESMSQWMIFSVASIFIWNSLSKLSSC